MGRQTHSDLFTTTISEAEMRGGLKFLPAGKRRDQLAAAIEIIFMQEFAGRILPFDGDAARAFPAIVAAVGRRAGPVMHPDLQIAAIASAHGAALATWNVKDFAGCGIPLINPWTA
jgi:predicted nucleic acid-binding protein